jgi:hypothetical protein
MIKSPCYGYETQALDTKVTSFQSTYTNHGTCIREPSFLSITPDNYKRLTFSSKSDLLVKCPHLSKGVLVWAEPNSCRTEIEFGKVESNRSAWNGLGRDTFWRIETVAGMNLGDLTLEMWNQNMDWICRRKSIQVGVSASSSTTDRWAIGWAERTIFQRLIRVKTAPHLEYHSLYLIVSPKIPCISHNSKISSIHEW